MRLAARLTDDQVEALMRKYGPPKRVDAVSNTRDGIADQPPTAPAMSGPSPRDVESQAIKTNATTPEANGPHPFMAAEFPGDDDQPRCRLCGKDEVAHAAFLPEIPIAASTTPFVYQPTTSSISANTAMLVSQHQPTTTTTTSAVSRPAAPVVAEGQTLALPDDTVKAFVTELNGRTVLTAPANVFTREVEQARAGNKHFLWMQGRFVGAEKANRNGSFWATEDLELGQASVANGPLIWLHEARHVIGTVARAQLVVREEAVDRDLAQPYIEAASAIWRWIYPDEAWVIEQASDAHKLWYCVDDETEVMTSSGWRRYEGVAVDEPILTLDRTTGLSRWTPVEKVHRFDLVDEDLIAMEGQQHSSLTTPSHKWWVDTRRGTGLHEWNERTTTELAARDYIPRSMPHGDYPDQSKFSDDFVELVAWSWTDASHGRRGNDITSANPSLATPAKWLASTR